MKTLSAPRTDCENRAVVTPTNRESSHLGLVTKGQITKVNEQVETECGVKPPNG